MTTHRRLLPALALLLLALALPSAASAQATRTWVSGVGDDANPCSRTAPCKTFAGSISKTASGGEINVLDAGGFGGVTITKPVSIIGRGPTAGALVSSTNAIVINLTNPSNGRVTIKGLDFHGAGSGTGAPISLAAIKVLAASRVVLKDNTITDFKAGILVAPTTPGVRVFASENDIRGNGIGAAIAPAYAAGPGSVLSLRHNDMFDNVCQAVVSGPSFNASTPTTTDCGTGASNAGPFVRLRVFHNALVDGAFGVYARGATATADIGDNEITGNATAGMFRANGGLIRSYGDNDVVENGPSSMAPSSTAGKQ